MFHVNKKGELSVCRAIRGKCPYKWHFATREEGQEFLDKQNKELVKEEKKQKQTEIAKLYDNFQPTENKVTNDGVYTTVSGENAGTVTMEEYVKKFRAFAKEGCKRIGKNISVRQPHYGNLSATIYFDKADYISTAGEFFEDKETMKNYLPRLEIYAREQQIPTELYEGHRGGLTQLFGYPLPETVKWKDCFERYSDKISEHSKGLGCSWTEAKKEVNAKLGFDMNKFFNAYEDYKRRDETIQAYVRYEGYGRDRLLKKEYRETFDKLNAYGKSFLSHTYDGGGDMLSGGDWFFSLSARVND